MKFELNLAVKAVPMEDCHISLECTAEELAVALADPVYQRLGEAIVAKIQQANHPNHDNRKVNGNRPQQDRFDHLRKYLEADVKQLKTADRITNERIDILSKRVDQIFDHIIKQ
jgi:hypothetical protein